VLIITFYILKTLRGDLAKTKTLILISMQVRSRSKKLRDDGCCDVALLVLCRAKSPHDDLLVITACLSFVLV